MSLEDLEKKNLLAPVEKELSHQKEQKANWKNLAKKYKNLLDSYATHNRPILKAGLMDPEEETLIKAAKLLSKEYDELIKKNSGS